MQGTACHFHLSHLCPALCQLLLIATNLSKGCPLITGQCGACSHAPHQSLDAPKGPSEFPTLTNSVLCRWNISLTGQAGVVSSRVKDTDPAAGSTASSRTKPHDTIFSPKSGSITFRSCMSTCSSGDRCLCGCCRTGATGVAACSRSRAEKLWMRQCWW